MNWIELNEASQLNEIIQNSSSRPQLIFKHSTRCSISSMVKNRLDKNTMPRQIDFYYLDLLNHRSISNQIAETFRVMHESPQVLLIVNGACIYDESHTGISMDEIAKAIPQKK